MWVTLLVPSLGLHPFLTDCVCSSEWSMGLFRLLLRGVHSQGSSSNGFFFPVKAAGNSG